MRKTTAMTAIAIAGLASAAAAQTASLNIAGMPTTVDAFGTTVFTVDIVASADFGTHISGGGFALDSTYHSGNDASVLDMDASASAWAAVGENDFGYAGQADYNGLVFGQVIFPPFFPPAPESSLSGDVVVAHLQITINPILNQGPIILEMALAALDSAPFTIEVYNDADGTFTQLGAEDVNFGSATLVIFPSPSGIALLGLAGLGAARRRR